MTLGADARAIRQLLAKDARTPRAPAHVPALGLLEFIPAVTPHYEAPRHLAPIVEHLEAVEGGPVRLACNAPPRHAKTDTLLHAVAWWLVRHPDWTIGYASHSAALALSKSRLAREYARRVDGSPDPRDSGASRPKIGGARELRAI
jgi:hypothetical protein